MTAVRLRCAALLTVMLAGCVLHSSHDAVSAGVDLPAVPTGNDHVGAALEALPANLVSADMVRQRKALAKLLVAESAGQDWQVTQLADDSLQLQSSTEVSFGAGSAQLRPAALNVYAGIARVATEYGNTVIHVIAGGGDAIPGDSRQSLSERRAASVAAYLSVQGIDGMRLRFEGRVLQKPEAVKIIIEPVIEGSEPRAWTPPS
jgi:outer membrane protein OmpA-like peptidoglycan-associated protein